MAFSRISAILLRQQISVKPDSRKIARWVAPTLKELKRRRDKIGDEPEKPRSTFLEWNYDAEIFAFGKRLGEEFDKKLLQQALIQKEYANMEEIKAEKQGAKLNEKVHNADLISEGEQIIKDYITSEYKKSCSDDITAAVTNYLTSEDMLSHVGKHMGLTDIILTTEFPVEKSTIANTFKAVVAALKRSKDLNRAQLFVKDFVINQMNGKDVYEIWNPQNPYEYLVKLLQEKGISEIEPRLCNKSATNTILSNYQVGLYNNKKLLGIGWGESVDIAKETAALDAIQRIHSNAL